jgi:N utilization substance protein A
MNNLFESFTEFKNAKNINRQEIMAILEEVFRAALVKKYGSDDNFDIIVNTDQGDLEIFRNREVVEDDFDGFDPARHIRLSEVVKVEPDFEVGEEYTDEIKLSDFGHRTILGIRQNLMSKVTELRSGNVCQEYRKKIGEVIAAEVVFANKREAVLQDANGTELVIPRREQIPSDFMKKGDYVKAVIMDVIEGSKPTILMSRKDTRLVEHLLEFEIPEIMDGVISIEAIAREAGDKTKVAVESYDDRIDAVGICIGSKGSRLFGVKKELHGENVDVIRWTSNTSLFIQRALSPAKVTEVRIDEASKKAVAFMKGDQMALAIGKGGVNIRLAGELTGYDIEVYSEDVELVDDVNLDDFSDEIEIWIIDAFKKIGLDTAKGVLSLSREDLIDRTDLEEETIDEVIAILSAEFE